MTSPAPISAQAAHDTLPTPPVRVCVVGDRVLWVSLMEAMLERSPFQVAATERVSRAASVLTATAATALVVEPDPAALVAAVAHVVGGAPAASSVVAVGSSNEPAFVRRVLAAGAVGYVPSTVAPRELWDVVEVASSGELALDARTASQMVSRFCSGNELTVRELEVLALVVEGCNNDEIAAALFVSRSTVASMLSSVCVKLNVSCRTTAAVAALRQGLVS